MKYFKLSFIALAFAGASISAKADLVGVDLDGASPFSVDRLFSNLKVSDQNGAAPGELDAFSFYFDTNDSGGINGGDLVIDTASIPLIFDDLNSTGINSIINGFGNLELSYFLAGYAETQFFNIDDGNGGTISEEFITNPNFEMGLFNIFTTDQSGVRTGLAASFSLDTYEVNLQEASTDPEPSITFTGTAVEAGSGSSVGGFYNEKDTAFADLIADNLPPTFFAELAFTNLEDVFTSVTQLNSSPFILDGNQQTLAQVTAGPVNANTGDNNDRNFSRQSPFIESYLDFDTGSDSIFRDFYQNIRLPNSDELAFFRQTAFTAEKIVIDQAVSAPSMLGAFGACLLALVGLRRRKA